MSVTEQSVATAPAPIQTRPPTNWKELMEETSMRSTPLALHMPSC